MRYFDNLFLDLCSMVGKLFLSDFAGLDNVSYGFFVFALFIALIIGFLGGGKKRVR